MKNINRKVPVLFLLRALASISVCFFHYFVMIPGFITNQLALKVFSHGKFGVDMFFVISGFIIPWSMYYEGYRLKNFFVFLFKRLARLEPPYFFSILILVIVQLCSHISLNPTQIALHFGYLIPFFKDYKWLTIVYWTLAIEFQYYLFMAIAFPLLVRYKLLGRLIFYMGCMASTLLFNIYGHGDLMTSEGTFLPNYFPIFILGILLFLKKIQKISAIEYYSITTILFIYCFHQYGIGSALYIAAAIIAILFFPDIRSKITDFFGEISYSLYLVHNVIGVLVIKLLWHNFNSPIMKGGLILGVFAISIASAYLMYLLIEKPSKRFSSKIRYNTKNEGTIEDISTIKTIT